MISLWWLQSDSKACVFVHPFFLGGHYHESIERWRKDIQMNTVFKALVVSTMMLGVSATAFAGPDWDRDHGPRDRHHASWPLPSEQLACLSLENSPAWLSLGESRWSLFAGFKLQPSDLSSLLIWFNLRATAMRWFFLYLEDDWRYFSMILS